MNEPFYSPKYLIRRAKQHIDELDRQITVFMNSGPCSYVVEPNADLSEDIHKIKLTKPMPVDLPGIVFDAANTLRSILDQSVFTVVLLATGKKIRNAFFPLGTTERDFENTMKGRLTELPENFKVLIRSFKPYKGGDSTLWALNELANSNKHATVYAAAIYTTGIHIKELTVRGPSKILVPRWDRTNNEMVVARVKAGSEYDAKVTIPADVLIGDIEFIDGQPIVAVFRHLLGVVESICLALEAEAKRVGLIKT